MIVRARHDKFLYSFFKLYTLFKIRRNFRKVTISGEFTDRNLPVLLIANHISWWDGFWAMYLNLMIFKRKFHFMMLEDQLEKFWFFKRTGGFSVRKGSRSILETLNHVDEILSGNRNIILIFPQGEIQSLYSSEFRFERGIERILENNAGRIHVVFVANLIDYFSTEKPSLFIYFKEYSNVESTVHSVEKEYNAFYASSILVNIEMRGD